MARTGKRSCRKSENTSRGAAAVKEEAVTQQEQRSVRRKTGTLNGEHQHPYVTVVEDGYLQDLQAHYELEPQLQVDG